MLPKLFARSTFAFTGWTFNNQMPTNIKQCVMIAAPHTSNWDALYTRLAFVLMGIPVKITIKDSYMRFPYGPAIRYLGGIGINRRPKKDGEERPSMVQLMADLFKTHPDLVMLVTPEGTRSLRTKWKTGFYHIAVAANVPIALGYLDYKKKEAGEGAWRFIDGTKIMSITANLGDAKTTITHPASTTHGRLSPEAKAAAFITEGLIRIAVGLEDINDLKADCERGFANMV